MESQPDNCGMVNRDTVNKWANKQELVCGIDKYRLSILWGNDPLLAAEHYAFWYALFLDTSIRHQTCSQVSTSFLFILIVSSFFRVISVNSVKKGQVCKSFLFCNL